MGVNMGFRVCENCGEIFEAKHHRTKYCKRECYEEAQRKLAGERYRKRTGKLQTESEPILPKVQLKVCSMCGKPVTEAHRSKYCSSACALKSRFLRMQSSKKKKVKRRENETLCWTCQNACCGCSWSSSFTPVEGWEAKPTDNGYFVVNCPQYVPDDVREGEE